MRGRVVAFVAIAWLASGAPLESSPFVTGAPQELAGIEIDDNPHEIAKRCAEKQLHAIEINDYTYCTRVMPPPAPNDACIASATEVALMTATLSPAEVCEPFLVASRTHRGATMTLVIPVPRDHDVAAVQATIEKLFDWHEHRWEGRGDHERTTISRTIRVEGDLQRFAIPASPQLAGYVVVELEITSDVDPYPRAPCKTEGCGCMKRTACPA